jgi:TonB family protein
VRFRFAVGGLVGVVLSAASLSASAEPVRTPPDWVRRPTSEMIMSVYPTEAFRKGVSGDATIGCRVGLQGTLFDCEVLSEKPPGDGFGSAAIAIAPQLRMTPERLDGVAVEGAVAVHIVFDHGGPRIGSHLSGHSAVSAVLNHRVLTQPTWAAAPTAAQTAGAYPARAARDGAIGAASVRCFIQEDYRLKRCLIVNEEPRGFAFGAAARNLADHFVLEPPPGLEEQVKGIEVSYTVAFDPRMAQAGPPVTGRPSWRRMPTGEMFAASYPAAARAAGVSEARILLDCDIAEGGWLNRCSVRAETPDGFGFGAAALSLADQFQTAVWTAEGLPTVGGRITLPIRYALPPAPAAAPAP